MSNNIVNIRCGDKMIAKKVTINKTRQFSGIIYLAYDSNYANDEKHFLSYDDVVNRANNALEQYYENNDNFRLSFALSNIETLFFYRAGKIVNEPIMRIYGKIYYNDISDENITQKLVELFNYLSIELRQTLVFDYQGFNEKISIIVNKI